MKTIFKFAAAAALTGALAVAAVTPSEARNGRNAAAAIGFGAGALIGAAAASANSGYYYGPGYYDSGYAYAPGYAYEPDYAYEPAPVYVAPSYGYRSRNNYRPSCAVDMGYGRLDYSGC